VIYYLDLVCLAYIDNGLNRAKNSSHGGADKRNGGDEASLSDQNVEKGLVDVDELAEGVSNCSGRGNISNRGGVLHRGDGAGGG